MRDMDVLQQHQEMFKEKQQERDSAGFKAQQMMEKQQKLEDSEGDEDESKAAQQPTNSMMIDTTEKSAANDLDFAQNDE